jgi:hypothetical protein
VPSAVGRAPLTGTADSGPNGPNLIAVDVVVAAMAAADKEAKGKKAGAEAADKEAAEEAVAKEVVDKKVAAGPSKGPSASGPTPSLAVRAKRAATLSGSTLPAKRPYKGVWKPPFVNFPVFSFLHLVTRLIFH